MIVTVTMNPAIDKMVSLERFQYSGMNRVSNVEKDAGGKGVNVSKAIKELGGKSIATGFIGGNNGNLIEKFLEENGIEIDFVHIDGETRTNTKLAEKNGNVTELNELGPVVGAEKLEELKKKLVAYAKEGVWFVLSGSVPPGVSEDIYREIIEEVHKKGAKVFLDAYGELFVRGLEAKPDIVKPNRDELEQYFDMDYRASESELAELGNRLLNKGVGRVMISMGAMGVIAMTKDDTYRCPGLRVPVNSAVGAGDAMVAAIVYGIDSGLSEEEMIRLSIAVSAGAVSTVGTKPPALALVEELKAKTTIQRF